MHGCLWAALRLESVLRFEGSYKFAHDRIQEAVYFFLPEELRADAHLRIGRLPVEHVPLDKHEDAIFEIVVQLTLWHKALLAPTSTYCRVRVRSVLCLPLVNQSGLIGVLDLENDLAPHVFTPARIAVLKLLASQTEVALENARLYRDVAKREAKIRRLIDANGTYMWKGTDKALRSVTPSSLRLMTPFSTWLDTTVRISPLACSA
jgi:GAF domain-containing protein